MDSYNIRLKPSVDKDVRRIAGPELRRGFERIESLAVNPFPRGALKLSGAEGLYRIRVGDYRIVYDVDISSFQILIHYIRHRRDVYKNL
jgi:mRNA interferase RelE/StbE